MSNFGEPVAQDVQSPNTLQSLMSITSLQKAQQDIQAQKLSMQGQASVNQSLASKAQGDTQDMQERQAYTQMMKSGKDDQGNSIMQTDANGHQSPNLAVVIPALGRIAPKNAQTLAQNLIKTENDKVGLQASAVGLDNANRQNLQGIVQSGVANSSKDVNASLDQYVQQHPEAAPTANFIKNLTPYIDHAPDPQKKISMVQSIASRLQPGTPVGTQAAPGSMDTGGTIQPGTVAPAVAGGGFTPSGAPIPKTIPPGAERVKDANDRDFVLNPATNRVTPIGTGYGGGKGPAAPNAPRFVQPTADAATVQKNIAAARDAGDQAPLNAHINDQLIRLSNDTATGYGTQKWHEAIGALSGGKFGSDYQTIGAYLDRQAAMASRSMGLPDTNAGLAASQSLSGHAGYSADALQTKVKLADTLNTAAQQFRQGLDRTVGVGPNQDNSRYEAYRSAWARNFDPQVFAVDNAMRRGDTTELNKIKQQEGPRGMAELVQKTQALRALANGQIPQ